MKKSLIAEVIGASTGQFVAELYKEAILPRLGSWVQVSQSDDTVIYGLVCQAEMGPFDEHRRPVALKRTPEELRTEMPHVLELLRTTFRVTVCAHRDNQGHLRQTLPVRPVRIHDGVQLCDGDFVQQVGAPYDFLRILVNLADPTVPVDEVLVAVLADIAAAHSGDDEVVSAGRALSRLFKDDHERLQSILRRAV